MERAVPDFIPGRELCQLGGLSGVSDEVSELPRIRHFYEN